ncbi:MAG: UDP-N-acetylmuramate--L-alanine ligase [Candidatus Obscuribacterales bacterium]|nr:UDP-N-acetylmuramate--L-alanine ligase [Candidatus Obscuribacterales bacterium]
MELKAASSAGQTIQGTMPPKIELNSLTGAVHFIGIGGIGMSALARILLAQGRSVSGSDKQASPITEELQSLGATIYIGQQASNVEKASAIVISTAITGDNPEYAQATARKLPIFHRSDMLAAICAGSKVIGVSGTHGKTTTTGMVAQVLLDCGLDPSVVVGGLFGRLKSNSYAGSGEYFVAEADESDRTHANLPSYISIVTNIEPDHLENYPGGMNQILETMAAFANSSQFATVLCSDDAGCRELMPKLTNKVITYGTSQVSAKADYQMTMIDESSFSVRAHGKDLGTINLPVPGMHNRMNALCACAVALELGQDFEKIAHSLSSFGGVDRRFQHIGQTNDITIVDDYGHHPTEVQATLEAAQQYKRGLQAKSNKINHRVVAVFQPHQPRRLQDLWQEFCQSFKQADLVLVADVYVARGGQIDGINSERFVKEVEHKNAHYLGGPTADLPNKIHPHLQPGDIVLTIGAGDITGVGKPLLELLRKEPKNGNCR